MWYLLLTGKIHQAPQFREQKWCGEEMGKELRVKTGLAPGHLEPKMRDSPPARSETPSPIEGLLASVLLWTHANTSALRQSQQVY